MIDTRSTGPLAGAAWKQEVEMKVEMGQGLPSSEPLSPTEAHYLLGPKGHHQLGTECSDT